TGQSIVNFTAGSGTLGLGGNFATGNSTILITGGQNLVNGIIGGWAVVGGTDFASYRSTLDANTGAIGIGAVGLNPITTFPTPFGAYSAAALTAGTASDNITIAASASPVTTRTINSLRISAVSTVTMNSPTDTLTIGTGGFIANGAASVV